jgi:murein DD-endopeptidase MepM/ murein hydrolase activator NlpD
MVGGATLLFASWGAQPNNDVRELFLVPTRDTAPIPQIGVLPPIQLVGVQRVRELFAPTGIDGKLVVAPMMALIPAPTLVVAQSDATPLPYPTTPPLAMPALPNDLLLTRAAMVGKFPFVGEGCAPSGFPVQGSLNQRFHEYHLGVDLGVPSGTPVLATQSGIVLYADMNPIGYGNLVILMNDNFITYYAHNSALTVIVGERVGRGSLIAYSGNTGNSSGPHVHYEVRVNDVPVDPMTFDDSGYASC